MRGQLSKELITKGILSVFPGSFIASDGKTIRIPTTCEGEPIEVKISMTAAKDIVGNGGEASLVTTTKQAVPQNTTMTEAEIEEVRRIIAELHL